jgi:hypothetical protein
MHPSLRERSRRISGRPAGTRATRAIKVGKGISVTRHPAHPSSGPGVPRARRRCPDAVRRRRGSRHVTNRGPTQLGRRRAAPSRFFTGDTSTAHLSRPASDPDPPADTTPPRQTHETARPGGRSQAARQTREATHPGRRLRPTQPNQSATPTERNLSPAGRGVPRWAVRATDPSYTGWTLSLPECPPRCNCAVYQPCWFAFAPPHTAHTSAPPTPPSDPRHPHRVARPARDHRPVRRALGFTRRS